jgi:hypothetical protein
MYVVSLDMNVWIHKTPNLAAAKRIQKRIQQRGFWVRKTPGFLECSHRKFRGAKHFAEFFPDDILVHTEEECC